MELLIGLLLPPVIEVVNKDVHNDAERYIVALLICVAVSVGIDWQAVLHTNLTSLFATLGIVSMESQVIFNLYWKDSFLRNKLQEKLGVDRIPPNQLG